MKPSKRTKLKFDSAAQFADIRARNWDPDQPITWTFQFRYLEGALITKSAAEIGKAICKVIGGEPKHSWPPRHIPEEPKPKAPRFVIVRFVETLSEAQLARLHTAFDRIAYKYGLDYGGVIDSRPPQDSWFADNRPTEPDMSFDAAALFSHLRRLERRPRAMRFRMLWRFDFCHGDFQVLARISDSILDELTAALGRTPRRLEPTLAETRLEIDERGRKSKGPPSAEVEFTDFLSEAELVRLHQAFAQLADRHRVTYEGVSCYDPPPPGWRKTAVQNGSPSAKTRQSRVRPGRK
jgi:hypothetical protein